ncbi:polycystic kidney disease protein 1-like 2 isoform X2 [Nematostella vectensis]|nr:polycystic kidney disease protein 1-like 2 isoform X2 [Nematostella vectensis]
MSNILESAGLKEMTSKTIEQERRTSNDVKNMARELTGKVFQALRDVGSVLLSRASVGDAPLQIFSANVNLTLERNDASSIGNKSVTCTKGSVKLPRTESLNINTRQENKTIDIQLAELRNPFTWSVTSKNMTSSVIDLVLMKNDGSSYDVRDTNEDIELNFFITKKPEDTSRALQWYWVVQGNESRRIHQIDWTSPATAINMEVAVESSSIVQWKVLFNFGKEPSSKDYVLSWSLTSMANTSGQLHTFPLRRTFLPYQGLYYVLITPDLTKQQTLLWRSGDLNISYGLGFYESGCWYWDEKQDKFSSKGCKVGPKTSRSNTQCMCDHLTSFVSKFVVVPNAIDFAAAMTGFLELSENPVAFSAVMTIFGIYLILLVWARKRDLIDDDQVKVVFLQDNNHQDKYIYQITVYTGMRKHAGTTADVFCVLVGDENETRPRLLKDPAKIRFKRAGVDTFILATPVHLGKLTSIKLWHNNMGSDPSWYVNKVSVRNVLRGQVYHFLCSRWFAVEHDDGQIHRTISVASKGDIETFSHLFYHASHKNITDGHLWFSVFTRPAKSRFTRVQRLSCCLTLLYCAMLANAMFYGLGNESNPAFTVRAGPLIFTPQQIFIGIASSLVIFPVNLCIVGIFRSVAPKKRKESNENTLTSQNAPEIAETEDLSHLIQWYKCAGQLDVESGHIIAYDNFAVEDKWLPGEQAIDLNFNGITNLRRPSQHHKPPKQLPHGFVYIGWFVVISLSFTSAFFVTLYGFQFGKEKAAEWLTSMFISVVQDVLISQPIKVLVVALIIALFVKKIDEDPSIDPEQHKMYLAGRTGGKIKMTSHVSWLPSCKPPDTKELKKAREKRLNEIKMNLLIKELIIYVLFLAALLLVGFAHRDPQAFQVAKLMTETFIDGAYAGNGLVQSPGVTNYWKWIENTVVPSLSSDQRAWAPGCQPLTDYAIDCDSRVVGTARLRQLRVPPDSCSVPQIMRNVSSGCNTFYSFFGEDTSHYTEGWKATNVTQVTAHSPWLYHSTLALDGLPYLGLLATYSGGGYTVELHNTDNGKQQLQTLKKLSWIDHRTRALFVEISIYNAQVNMFGIATFLAEWIPTNGVLFFNNIKVARLYVAGGDLQAANIAAKFFVVLFFCIFIYDEAKQIRTLRKKYLKDVWNWLEITLIILIIGCSVTLLKRSTLTYLAIKKIQEEPKKFVSLIQAATMDELLTYFEGLLVFVANIKLLKLCRFNHRIFMFTKTLSTAVEPLLSFLIVFLIFYLAYSSIYYLVFGSGIYEYRSMVSTIETLFSTLLGGYDYHAIANHDPILGPALFFSFQMIMVMILMNVFLTILMDAFAEVQADTSFQSNKHELVDYMTAHFKQFLKLRNKVQDVGNSRQDINNCLTDTIDKKLYRKLIPSIDSVRKDETLDGPNEQGEVPIDSASEADDTASSTTSLDPLEMAISRAVKKNRERQIIDDDNFNFDNYKIITSGTNCVEYTAMQNHALQYTPDKTPYELLDGIKGSFARVGLDELLMDAVYEKLLRYYVKDERETVLAEKIRRQNELSSWQLGASRTTENPSKLKVYSRYGL